MIQHEGCTKLYTRLSNGFRNWIFLRNVSGRCVFLAEIIEVCNQLITTFKQHKNLQVLKILYNTTLECSPSTSG